MDSNRLKTGVNSGAMRMSEKLPVHHSVVPIQEKRSPRAAFRRTEQTGTFQSSEQRVLIWGITWISTAD